MMAPEVYERSRADAPIHVQIRRSDFGRARPGRVEGRVLRIFRDSQYRLHWGQRIAFSVPVIEHTGGAPMPSGDIHLDWDRLNAARWVEAFLEAWDGNIHLVRSQIAPIRGPTLKPVCGPGFKGFTYPGNFYKPED